ncbi:MAG TPA: endopeptidase La [bacterium]|nr:endopeptidase La [bacterium]
MKSETLDINTQKKTVPLVPLKDIVVFPHTVVPVLVGRPRSVKAVEEAMLDDKLVVFAAQRVAAQEDPAAQDIHDVGTLCRILQTMRASDGSIKLLTEGVRRVRVVRYLNVREYFSVEIEGVGEGCARTSESEALIRSARTLFEKYVGLSAKLPQDIVGVMQEIEDPGKLADFVASNSYFKIRDKQGLLSLVSPAERLKRVVELLTVELEILEIEKKLNDQVKKQIEDSQKHFYLHEQLKAIERELGRETGFGEVEEMREKIRKAQMPKEAEEKALKELARLSRMNVMTPEYAVVKNYLDILLDLPWHERTEDNLDLAHARSILDEDHYGLDDPKERILEFLAVRKLTKNSKGSILCFSGPPGVGKTSLAKSIARALGRKFTRISLGGVRDEAEIRGHRRTYVGALPGRIVQSLRKIKHKNPVFLLDEIDKLSRDFHGDPASALLEVLDPEQNGAFSDHFLEVDYDLSDVMFITTANVKDNIHPTLRDRMEVIEISSYTEFEKLKIAKLYLVPKQVRENGLTAKDLKFNDGALQSIVREYTREAGVRGLERELAKVARKVAKDVVESGSSPVKRQGGSKTVAVTAQNLHGYLGNPKYHQNGVEENLPSGLAVGLAWTPVGGDIIYVESTMVSGRGSLILTGQLGDVMKESAKAALTVIRAMAKRLGVPEDFYRKTDLHIHIPEGAISKDGPSAGIAMVVSIISALLKKPMKKGIAMTGEITLRGKILRIGGVKEKAIAAHRSRIRKVVLPLDNKSDLSDIPEIVRKEIDFVFVQDVEDVIKEVFTKEVRSS